MTASKTPYEQTDPGQKPSPTREMRSVVSSLRDVRVPATKSIITTCASLAGIIAGIAGLVSAFDKFASTLHELPVPSALRVVSAPVAVFVACAAAFLSGSLPLNVGMLDRRLTTPQRRRLVAAISLAVVSVTLGTVWATGLSG